MFTFCRVIGSCRDSLLNWSCFFAWSIDLLVRLALESGNLYSFGAGGDGQLGHGNTEVSIYSQ